MAFWNELGTPPCNARFDCPFLEGDGCSYSCYTYHSIQSLYDKAEIPVKYRDNILLEAPKEDKANFIFLNKFKNNIVEHVANGHGLFLVSATKGNGKTSWAIKILKHYLYNVALNTDIGVCKGIYVNVPQYMKRLKDNIDVFDEGLSDLKFKLETADLVIWDDIGREKPTDYSREVLYSHINYRYENNKSQILTSNKVLEILKDPKILGEEIVDRITEQCAPLEFLGKGRRQDKAWWNTK